MEHILTVFVAIRFQEELKAVSEERASLKQELDSVRSTAAILQDEKLKLTQDVSESKKEQDDLLILLADQDQKILSLKNKLKELGEQVQTYLFFSVFCMFYWQLWVLCTGELGCSLNSRLSKRQSQTLFFSPKNYGPGQSPPCCTPEQRGRDAGDISALILTFGRSFLACRS